MYGMQTRANPFFGEGAAGLGTSRYDFQEGLREENAKFFEVPNLMRELRLNHLGSGDATKAQENKSLLDRLSEIYQAKATFLSKQMKAAEEFVASSVWIARDKEAGSFDPDSSLTTNIARVTDRIRNRIRDIESNERNGNKVLCEREFKAMQLGFVRHGVALGALTTTPTTDQARQDVKNWDTAALKCLGSGAGMKNAVAIVNTKATEIIRRMVIRGKEPDIGFKLSLVTPFIKLILLLYPHHDETRFLFASTKLPGDVKEILSFLTTGYNSNEPNQADAWKGEYRPLYIYTLRVISELQGSFEDKKQRISSGSCRSCFPNKNYVDPSGDFTQPFNGSSLYGLILSSFRKFQTNPAEDNLFQIFENGIFSEQVKTLRILSSQKAVRNAIVHSANNPGFQKAFDKLLVEIPRKDEDDSKLARRAVAKSFEEALLLMAVLAKNRTKTFGDIEEYQKVSKALFKFRNPLYMKLWFAGMLFFQHAITSHTPEYSCVKIPLIDLLNHDQDVSKAVLFAKLNVAPSLKHGEQVVIQNVYDMFV